MAHRPNASALDYSYEYYLDYLDLLPVDEKKLKANKHAVVIAFWVSLAALVALLFLFLLCMSCSSSPQTRIPRRGRPAVPPGGWASAPAPRPGVAQRAGTLARTQATGPGWQRDRPRAEHGETPHPTRPAPRERTRGRRHLWGQAAGPARPASSPSGPLNNVQHQRTRRWSPGLNCPLCLRRHLLSTGHVGDPAGSPELGGGTRQQSTWP
nr:uncharacterized protein LOC118966893 [Manis javanica]